MSTKADFYAGRGPRAEWLGSIAWDGMPDGIPKVILEAKTVETYREKTFKFLKIRGDSTMPEEGWPWEHDSSHGTNYTYAFDKDKVFASCYGSSWWQANLKEPDHTTLKRKFTRVPDMSLARKKHIS